jgi:hypothetical protein
VEGAQGSHARTCHRRPWPWVRSRGERPYRPFTGRATNADPYSTNHIVCGDVYECSTLRSEDLPSFRAINDNHNLRKRASNISLYDALADVEARSVGEPESLWSRVTGKRPGIETYNQYVEHPVGKFMLPKRRFLLRKDTPQNRGLSTPKLPFWWVGVGINHDWVAPTERPLSETLARRR